MIQAHTLHAGTNYKGQPYALAGCENDVRDVYGYCKDGATSSCKVSGAKFDRETFVRAFRRMRHRLEKPGDTLFVSLSHHGTREWHKGRYVEAMVMHDGELIYDYEWADECADRVKGTFIIGLLDFCHSELMHRSLCRKRSIPVANCRSHKHAKDTKPRALTNCGFIAGCEVHGYSYDGVFNGRPNGALTYYTLQAIRSLRRGSTFNDLFRKVGGRGGALPSTDYPQRPTRMGSRANFAREIPFL